MQLLCYIRVCNKALHCLPRVCEWRGAVLNAHRNALLLLHQRPPRTTPPQGHWPAPTRLPTAGNLRVWLQRPHTWGIRDGHTFQSDGSSLIVSCQACSLSRTLPWFSIACLCGQHNCSPAAYLTASCPQSPPNHPRRPPAPSTHGPLQVLGVLGDCRHFPVGTDYRGRYLEQSVRVCCVSRGHHAAKRLRSAVGGGKPFPRKALCHSLVSSTTWARRLSNGH